MSTSKHLAHEKTKTHYDTMPGVDEETALISPTSPPGCLLDDIDRGNLNLKQVNNNNNNNKEAPPKLLHP